MTQTQDWPRYTRWTCIIAILLALALLWMWFSGKGPHTANSCCGTSTAAAAAPSAAPITGAASAPAALPPSPAPAPTASLKHTATWQDNKLTLQGVVPDAVTRQALVAQASSKYGAENVIDKLTVDGSAAKAAVVVTLAGTVATDATKAARSEDAKAFYAALQGLPDVTIDNQLVVTPSPASLAATVAPAVQATDVACGSRMAVAATFATGSASLTPQARTLLDAVVPCMTGPYEVGGHTDSVGNAAANRTLSERRAQSVATYLISKGVGAKLMTTKGYGDTVPIGDNATAQGKATNRRIEFKKQ